MTDAGTRTCTEKPAKLLQTLLSQNAGVEVAEVSRQTGYTRAAWKIIYSRFGGAGGGSHVTKVKSALMHVAAVTRSGHY